MASLNPNKNNNNLQYMKNPNFPQYNNYYQQTLPTARTQFQQPNIPYFQ